MREDVRKSELEKRFINKRKAGFNIGDILNEYNSETKQLILDDI